jgi:TPR repeat protein
MKIRRLLFAVFALLPIWTFADYDTAVTAVERGNYAQALRELGPLLKRGDKDGQYLMGLIYFSGMGVQRNLRESIRYFRLASDQGHEYARLMLGVSLNANGEFVESARHLRWAADKGDPSAQFLLAMMYMDGKGVPQDYAETVQLFRAASNQGYAAAMTKLGQLYYFGQGGMKKNPAEAVRLFRMAAQKGDAQGQLMLGEAFYFGIGTAPNPQEAVSWWLKASANGEADADGRLGWAYHAGTGVKQDDREAAKWLLRGAEGGSPFAQLTLGTFYRDGIGVEKNLVTALMWMRVAQAQKQQGSAEHINHIVQFMTPQQINQADALAQQRLRQK